MAINPTSIIPYLGIFLAAVLEGEIVFAGACVLVTLGKLDPIGVFAAGALGGSAGDQAYFYLFRGRLRGWLGRFSAWRHNRHRMDYFVEKNSTIMILACRFLPGLRIIIQAACAHAGVTPIKFSALSLVGSAAWAGAILLGVAYFGPEIFGRFGVKGDWVSLIPALFLIGLFLCVRFIIKMKGNPGKAPSSDSLVNSVL